MGMGEFEMIRKYFLPLANGHKEARGFVDDAAVLNVPEGMELVVTSDTLSAGMHFLADQSVSTIARKALRSNISDILAMGAKPYCYQLCLALPKDMSSGFLEEFTAVLADEQKHFGLFLSGGDTTSILGPLTVTITMFGLVEKGQAIPRGGAKDGDLIVLSGPVGDAWCGLQMLRGDIKARTESCIQVYYTPDIPSFLNENMVGKVHAALDISDGLIADLGHMARASELIAEISLGKIIYSEAAQALKDAHLVSDEDLLTGGDDYQLLMAVPAAYLDELQACAVAAGKALQVIGHFKSGPARVDVYDKDNRKIEFRKSGWTHF